MTPEANKCCFGLILFEIMSNQFVPWFCFKYIRALLNWLKVNILVVNPSSYPLLLFSALVEVSLSLFIEAAHSPGTQCTFVLPVLTHYVLPQSFRREKRAIMLISCLLYNALKPIKKERQSKAVFFSPFIGRVESAEPLVTSLLVHHFEQSASRRPVDSLTSAFCPVLLRSAGALVCTGK